MGNLNRDEKGNPTDCYGTTNRRGLKVCLMNPLEWKPGTIIFHRKRDKWTEFLKSIEVHPGDLAIPERDFNSYHKRKVGTKTPTGGTYIKLEQQDLFRTLFGNDEWWSYFYKPIKKKNGDIACKVSSISREGGYTLTEVPIDEVYFVMEMLDWNFSHWCLLIDEKNFLGSLRNPGSGITKKPAKKTRERSTRIKHLYPTKKPGRGYLYHLVSCNQKDVWHPLGDIMNSRWSDYQTASVQGVEIYAVPYEPNIMTPVGFKSCMKDERLSPWINFPQGLPGELGENLRKRMAED